MSNEEMWTERGIAFEQDSVAKRNGPNASDKREVGEATIAKIVDLDKFRKVYGDAYIVNMANGTSLRVTCQRMWRDNIKMTPDQFDVRLDGLFRGARVASGPRVAKVIHTLPNGEEYTGTEEMEYRQLFVLALVEMGVPNDVAVAKSTAAKW